MTIDSVAQLRKNYDWRLIISMIVVVLMVYIRDLRIIPLSSFYYLGVLTIISTVLPYKSLRAFFYFIIPFSYSMHGGIYLPIAFFLIVRGKINLRKFLFPIFIAIFETIHFSTYTFDIEYGKYGMYIITVFLFFFMLFDEDMNKDDINEAIRCYVFGVSLVMFIIIVISTLIYSFDEVFLGSYRIGGDGVDFTEAEYTHTFMNANTLAYFSITAFSLLLFSKDIIQKVPIKILIYTLLVVSGILSASRTWIILMAITLFYFFYFSKVKGKLGFVLITIALLIVAAQFTTYIDAFSNRFSDRFGEENFQSAGGRMDIFISHNQYLFDNPERLIYGTGAVYNNEVSGLLSSHNGFQQIYFCYGIIGTIVFLLAAVLFYKLFTKKNRVRFWCCVPFFVCLLFDQSIQFLSPYVLMLPFVASVLPMKQKEGEVM